MTDGAPRVVRDDALFPGPHKASFRAEQLVNRPQAPVFADHVRGVGTSGLV
jgi:hypothetical protein